MKAIIHCGTYKTGSTAIQNTAYVNRHALRQHGVLYPNTGIQEMLGGAGGHPHRHFVYKCGRNGGEKLLSELDREIQTFSGNTLFISAEMWVRPDSADTLQAMVQHLRSRGTTEIRGVVCLRNVHEYMVRHYRQWIKVEGVKVTLPKYVIWLKHFFDYLTICRNIKAAFGGHVDFINYEQVEDMNRFIFQMMNINIDDLATPSQINRSLSCADTEIIRILNTYGLRLKTTPSAAELLQTFGLGLVDKGLTEKLPDGLLKVYDNKYLANFSSVTGFPRAQCKALFEERYKQGTDIQHASPILEKALFEWIKTH